ncbi:MAG: hypothetical protein IKG42_00075 [Clostridia bacterium]|nr:hypothetical protein [Clostridia bacterium]
MKKIFISMISIFIVFGFIMTPAFASTEVMEEKDVLETENGSVFGGMKEKAEANFAKYEKKYSTRTYAIVAMILDTIRIYSIPFCFLGIAIGAIYQYVLGIRKLDTRDKGFNLVIAFVTILVICQVLPIVFAIVTSGWVL